MRQSERVAILNADDLGLAAGVSAGILELAESHGITSASLLPNLPGSLTALRQANALELDVGVHLNLCVGMPLSPPHRVRSLLAENDHFAGARSIAWRLLTGRLRLAEVEREWSAQIAWVLDCGGRPSHLDSHVHVHVLPGLSTLILQLARHFGIRGVRPALAGLLYQSPWPAALHCRLALPTRPAAGWIAIRRPAHFSVLSALGPGRDTRPLRALLHALPPGVTELVAHPGHPDDELRHIDPLIEPREHDWRMLSGSELPLLLAHEGIRLISWAQLPA
jgi:predicted glycoside hydrolase/deacetylase ChbG (UPF0249 family)